ncbi:MAG TPA: permease-like cell division protein FtsX [Chitinophagaceae bacterium]|jgi:cell division transport system permease protein|nr:permease-like cell division protein FtsX [Chitinophagaceae bacterium]
MVQIGKSSGKRSQPSYAMAIIGVSLILIMLGVLGWFVINANKLGQYFKENVEVSVFIRENVSAKDSADLVQYLASQPYIKTYEYVTKDLAKKKYLDDGNKDWVGVLEKNPLPATIYFNIKSQYSVTDSLTKIQNDLEQNIAVSDVKYPQSLVSNLNNIIRKISLGLLVIAVIISIVVIILIDNTIRLAMFSNRFLIKTMQMVGATRGFIARPMSIRAIINGALSGVIAVIGILAVILVFEKWLPEIRALRDYTLLAMLFISIIFLGVVISYVSTHRSVIKYLKMKLDDLY